MYLHNNEKNENEVFVGNIKNKDHKRLHGLSYRVGQQAYDLHGKKIDTSEMRPLFIHKESFSEYNYRMEHILNGSWN